MTMKEAATILECMAIDITGALAVMAKANPMADVLEKRLEAIDKAQAALREQASNESQRVSNTSNALDGWISVEERLPECDQRVLCRYTFGDDGRMYFHQVLDYYATDPQPHFQHTLGDSKMRVTHWMPLPEAPKEEV